MLDRAQFQELAAERVRDAEALLSLSQWSGAYYLAGYAVECGLKACIAKLTNQHDYPNKEFAAKCYTHKIENLIEAAGLKARRDTDALATPGLDINWLIVKEWDEQSRYQRWAEVRARRLFSAVSDPANGVLPWIMGRW